MYHCPKCGNYLGDAATLAHAYGENPEVIECMKCHAQLSIRLPYAPPLKRHSPLRVLLGVLAAAALVAGGFLTVHVWRAIGNAFLAFAGAAGIGLLTLALFALSVYAILEKQRNPYAHGYNSAFSTQKRAGLERERASLLKTLCVLNGIFVVVGFFVAVRPLF